MFACMRVYVGTVGPYLPGTAGRACEPTQARECEAGVETEARLAMMMWCSLSLCQQSRRLSWLNGEGPRLLFNSTQRRTCKGSVRGLTWGSCDDAVGVACGEACDEPVSARACMARPTDQAPGADGLAVGVSLMVAVLVVAVG